MASKISRDRFASWINDNRQSTTKIFVKHLFPFFQELNEKRQFLYFNGAVNSNNIVEKRKSGFGITYSYKRKKPHTLRTKERKTYKRGSEFGGTKMEEVKHKVPMMMSGKSFKDVMGSFIDPKTAIMELIREEDLPDLTKKILRKNGNRGRMPKGYAYKGVKWKKAWENIRKDIELRVIQDGY